MSNTDPLEWALANERDFKSSIDRFIVGPRNLDWVLSPELDLIIGILDDPKRVAGLRRNEEAMAQLTHDCRLNHDAHAKAWGGARSRDRQGV